MKHLLNYYCMFSFVVLFLNTACAKPKQDVWWPQKCGDVDTSLVNGETVLTKYRCSEQGTKEVLTIVNGAYHGPYSRWDQSGRLAAKFRYHNDEIDGEIQVWDSTGFLIRSGMHDKGKTIGRHVNYFSRNHPKSISHYNSSGQKHGLSETWREDGTRKDSVVYEDDNFVQARYYYKTGKPRYWVKSFRNNQREEAYFYAPDGKSSGHIKKGSGVFTLHSEDAQNRYKYEYKDGNEISYIELDSAGNPIAPPVHEPDTTMRPLRRR